MSVYSASKAALRSLARTLSAELVGRRIRVNAVSPGPIETPIYGPLEKSTCLPAEAQQEMAASFTDRVPLKRFGNPDEIASAVLFLWELYPIVTSGEIPFHPPSLHTSSGMSWS